MQEFSCTVKPVLSGHSKRRPKIGFQDGSSLNSDQKYCRMLLTFIKLPFVIKIFVLSIFEWPQIRQVLLYNTLSQYLAHQFDFVLMFYIPFNNFSVMLGRFHVFLTRLKASSSRTQYGSESRTSNPSILSLTLYQLSHSVTSYQFEGSQSKSCIYKQSAKQCRSRSAGFSKPADLDLHCF